MKRTLTHLLRLAAPATFLLLALCPASSSAYDGCDAQHGTIATVQDPVCLVDGQAVLTAIPGGDAVVPDGFETVYILSRTNSLNIEQISPSPSFTVNTVDVWRIHTLVFDPATLDLGFIQFSITNLYALQNLLLQGGGDICASLDMSGAPMKTGECPPPECSAQAATLSGDSTVHCLEDGQATLTAVPTGPGVVPPGFTVTYLLTRTNGLIIEQISTTPSFTVNTVGVWRIHTLVFDSTTLDLGIIQFGVTNLYDLQDLLVQGGGTICASLDMSGAPMKTGECEQPCTADAGQMGTDQGDLCLTDGEATLNATPDGSANVPAGYSMAFLLSEGTGQVIQATGTSPQFTVQEAGIYRIHALVYNPATLDLAGIIPGQTSISDLNATLMQGGGGICASLDLTGAQFQVVACTPPCDADAGTLTADQAEVCLLNGSAIIGAASNGDTLVPSGLQTTYILTQGPGFVITEIGPLPSFTVTDTGLYAIHGLVYDPATLDLDTILAGTTTGYDLISMLIEGGGNLCGSFDFLGASVHVIHCPPPCTAGTDTMITVCYTDPPFLLFPLLGENVCQSGMWTDPAAPEVDGMFDPASDPAGVYMYTVTMSFGIVDTAFVVVNVVECPNFISYAVPGKQAGNGFTTSVAGQGWTGTVSVWPNPVKAIAHIELPFAISGNAQVDVSDATGRIVQVPVTVAHDEVRVDASLLSPGLWVVRIHDESHVFYGRFVRSAK